MGIYEIKEVEEKSMYQWIEKEFYISAQELPKNIGSGGRDVTEEGRLRVAELYIGSQALFFITQMHYWFGVGMHAGHCSKHWQYRHKNSCAFIA